jgi:hypothetical protein
MDRTSKPRTILDDLVDLAAETAESAQRTSERAAKNLRELALRMEIEDIRCARRGAR